MRDIVLVCVWMCVVVGGCGALRVVDLTWPHSESTVYWPGNPSYNFTIITRAQMSSYWYESNKFATAEHGGTHLDSPAHFYKGGWRVHEIPADRLVGPAAIIDVISKAAADPDYRVMRADIGDYETEHGRIPEGAIVIMQSGWGEKYPNKTLVFTSETPDIPSTFHFPGFHEDTVSWLINNRKIIMIGVDTPSVDYGQSTDFRVHVVAGMNNIPGLENVAHLDKIPARGATIVVGAVKLHDGSGGPARILAMYDTEKCECSPSSASLTSISYVLYALVSFFMCHWL